MHVCALEVKAVTDSHGCQSSRRGWGSQLMLSAAGSDRGGWGELSCACWFCIPPLVWCGHGDKLLGKHFVNSFPKHLYLPSVLSDPSFSLCGWTYFKRAERIGTTFFILHKQSISVGVQSVFKVLKKRRFYKTPQETFSQIQFFVSDLRPPCCVSVTSLNLALCVWETKHWLTPEGSYLDKLINGYQGSESVNYGINT